MVVAAPGLTAAQAAERLSLPLATIRLLRTSRRLAPSGRDEHGRPTYSLPDLCRAAANVRRRP
ncbi:hypothetical protein GCM10009738_64480 [Kitasatospora viridis]